MNEHLPHVTYSPTSRISLLTNYRGSLVYSLVARITSRTKLMLSRLRNIPRSFHILVDRSCTIKIKTSFYDNLGRGKKEKKRMDDRNISRARTRREGGKMFYLCGRVNYRLTGTNTHTRSIRFRFLPSSCFPCPLSVPHLKQEIKRSLLSFLSFCSQTSYPTTNRLLLENVIQPGFVP